MMRRRGWRIAIGIALACGAMAAIAAAGAASKTVTLTEKDDGTAINVRVGDRVVVRLAANPSTGYDWQVVKEEKEILAQDGEPGMEMPPGALIGAGGTRVMRFVAKKKGDATLGLEYVRSWEHGVAPAKTWSVTVRVR